MKNAIALILTLFLLIGGKQARAQSEAEKLDLPGDNLNLYAVMKLFQESETLEGFERKLNDEQTEVNNLDLDGDNQIDYIRVNDVVDGNLHTITLKVAVSRNEDQDVAAFYVEKKSNGEVWIQLVGDEALYGKDYIIEPNGQAGDYAETPNPGYIGARTAPVQTQSVIVSSWPVVEYIYVPSYSVWHSPWHYAYYPNYWRPWRPRYWHYYYGYHYHWHYYYNGNYRRWNTYRNPGWHSSYYSGYRRQSVIVVNRTSRGDYRKTYARPNSARQGSALFAKRYPTAPTSRERIPSFDRGGRPVVSRTGTSRPSTGNPSVTRPGTSRPETSRPGNERPGTSRPGTSRPGTSRPTDPEITRPTVPDNTRPAIDPPTTRPGNPRPTDPSSRPSTPRPTEPSSRETPRQSYPSPSRQSEPAPSRQSFPAPSRQSEPAPSRQSFPAPSRQSEPAPSRQSFPAPSRESAPAPSRQSAPEPPRQTAPAPSRQSAPAPSRESAPRSPSERSGRN